MTIVRGLNGDGIQQFQEFLAGGATETPPWSILHSTDTSEPLDGVGSVESRDFDDSMQAAAYLNDSLSASGDVLRSTGLWSWLALFYFDQLCPVRPDGSRHALRAEHYILLDDYRHYYRHLLAGPYAIYGRYGNKARVILKRPVHEHDDFSEQLSSRQELITNPGLIDVVDALYYDVTTGSPKRGARNRNRAGNIRRLVSVVGQLDLTYDLYGMSGPEILGLLPSEFSVWRRSGSQ